MSIRFVITEHPKNLYRYAVLDSLTSCYVPWAKFEENELEEAQRTCLRLEKLCEASFHKENGMFDPNNDCPQCENTSDLCTCDDR